MRDDWSNDYVGIPFALGGRTTSGIDCYGLVCIVYAKELGQDLPGHDASPGIPDDEWFEIAQEETSRLMLEWAPVDAPEPGDVWRFRVLGRPVHVGLHVNAAHFLHSMDSRMSGHERWTDSWRRRALACYRRRQS